MKKIAIIRGANLNKFEMQTHEVLKSAFRIEAFCIAKNNFNLEGINLPIHKLRGVEVFFPEFLKRYKRYYDFLFDFLLEVPQPMFGVTKELKDFDILHVADVSYYYSYQAAKAKRKYGSKLVAAHSENLPFFFGRNFISRRRIAWTVGEVDLFLPRTQRAKEVLLLLGVPKEKTEVVPYGIDTQVFKPGPKESFMLQRYGIKEDELVILFVGRIARSKGVLELIYAIKRLTDDNQLKHRRIKLILVGSGPLLKKVKKLVFQLNLSSSVVMIKNIEYEKTPEIYNLADIFVLPSLPTRWGQEKFGMVLIESMACAKPVVSTLCGSIPEVVGDTGLLAQPADHLSLYQALKRLVLNEDLREELGMRGRERVEANFSLSVVSQKIRQIYEAL